MTMQEVELLERRISALEDRLGSLEDSMHEELSSVGRELAEQIGRVAGSVASLVESAKTTQERLTDSEVNAGIIFRATNLVAAAIGGLIAIAGEIAVKALLR